MGAEMLAVEDHTWSDRPFTEYETVLSASSCTRLAVLQALCVHLLCDENKSDYMA